MFIEVNLSMSNSNSLVSAALLDAIWEERKKGIFDLLVPFVSYIIADNYSNGDVINLEKICLEMNSSFGFSQVPNSVIFQVLTQLTKVENNQVLKREGKSFKLIKDLSSEFEAFKEKFSKIKGSTELILKTFIKRYNSTNRKQITIDEAKQIFIELLSDNGYDVLIEPQELNNITMESSNKKTFGLAQYIIEILNDEDHEYYNAITGIASGALLCNLVYINTDVNEYKEKPLKNLKIYFDTSLLLFALGYKTDYQKKNMDCILNMLRINGAELLYYDNNLNELISILTAYKYRENNSNSQTLEFFDNNNIHRNSIDYYILNIENELSKIGFIKSELYDYPKNASEHQYRKYEIIDENGLKEYLKNNIEKYKDEQVSNDVACIASICRERMGILNRDLERSQAVWVTSNTNLVKHAQDFLGFSNDIVPPILSIYSLSTEIWIKYGIVDKSIPKQRLYENAQMALEPSKKVIEKCRQIIDELEHMDKIEPEVAAVVRYNRAFNKTIMNKVEGDETTISDTFMEGEIDLFVDELTEGMGSRNKELENENKILKEKVAGLQKAVKDSENYNNTQSQERQKKAKKQKDEIYKDIRNKANSSTDKKLKHITNICFIFAFILEAVAVILEGLFTFWSAKNEKLVYLTGSIVLIIITLLLFLFRIKDVKNQCENVAVKHRNNIYNKEYEKALNAHKRELDILKNMDK